MKAHRKPDSPIMTAFPGSQLAISMVSMGPSGMAVPLLPSSRAQLVFSTSEPPSCSLPPVGDSYARRVYRPVTLSQKRSTAASLLRITPAQYAILRSLYFIIGGTTFKFTPNAQNWPRSLNTLIGGTLDRIYRVVNDIGTPSGWGLDLINNYAFLVRFYTVYDTTNHRWRRHDAVHNSGNQLRRI